MPAWREHICAPYPSCSCQRKQIPSAQPAATTSNDTTQDKHPLITRPKLQIFTRSKFQPTKSIASRISLDLDVNLVAQRPNPAA